MEVNDAIAQEVLYKVTVVQEVLYMNYLSVRPLVLSIFAFQCSQWELIWKQSTNRKI